MGKIVDVKPPGQIIFHIGKPIGQGKGQLADGIGPGFGNVIAANAHGIKMLDAFSGKVFLDIPHLLCALRFYNTQSPTLTSILPVFSPWNKPINALGVFSMPSTMVSSHLILPSFIQDAISV